MLRIVKFLLPWLTLQVDISTMLEEAVQYVKFLQLQIKVATREALNFQLNVKKKSQYYTYAKTITDNFVPYMNLTASKLWWFVDVLSDCLQWNEHWTGTWYYPSKRNKGYAIAIKENAMQQMKRDWFYFVIFLLFSVYLAFNPLFFWTESDSYFLANMKLITKWIFCFWIMRYQCELISKQLHLIYFWNLKSNYP